MLKVRLQTHKAGPEASSRNIRYSQPSARPHSTNDSCVHRSGDEHADKAAHTEKKNSTYHLPRRKRVHTNRKKKETETKENKLKPKDKESEELV